MKKEQREELQHLKREVNAPKHDLIGILRRVENVSPTQARALRRILERLEYWQVR